MIFLRQLVLSVAVVAMPFAASAEWYSGGTLLKATGEQWVAASEANRLATSADFARVALGPQVVIGFSSVDELKPYANSIKDCIDVTFTDPSLRAMSVSEASSACRIMLGYE